MKELLIVTSFKLFLGLLYASSSYAQQPIEGHWEGMMIREGAKLPVSFDFTKEEAGLKASFNSLTQRAVGIPIRNVSFLTPKIHLELVGDTTTIVFDGEIAEIALLDNFVKMRQRGRLLCNASPRGHPRSSRKM